MEVRSLQQRLQPRHDAAADVDAATGTQRERQVAGGAAEEGEEQLQRFGAARATAVLATLGDAGRAEVGRGGHAVHRAQGLDQPHQARPRHRALGRGVAEALLQRRHHGSFARGDGRQRHVPAFACQRHPAAAHRHQAAHAQAGAGADQGDRCGLAVGRAAAGDLHRLVGAQQRQAARQRFEVVHHHQPLQPQRGAQCLDRERPVVVGHLHRVARHRVGDADGAQPGCGQAGLGEVAACCVEQRGVFGAGQHPHGLWRGAGPSLPGKAGVGAADVGQQARARLCGGQGGGLCARAQGGVHADNLVTEWELHRRRMQVPDPAVWPCGRAAGQASRRPSWLSNRCTCSGRHCRCTRSPTASGGVPGMRAVSAPTAVSAVT